MDDREQQRKIRHRLAVLRHADEVTGNVAATCRYYGISRPTFYKWLNRYEEHGGEGLRDRSSRPHHSPRQTDTQIVGKIVHLRTHYHFGPAKISMYLARYHDIDISRSGVWRVLKRLDMNRLPSSQRYKRHDRRWKRYEKPQPGHRVQVDVKFIEPVEIGAPDRMSTRRRKRYYQFTSIDDCTRVREAPMSRPHRTAAAVWRPAARVPALLVMLALLAVACASQGATEATDGTLPSADHVHSLRWTDDGLLLLGLHGALWRSDDQGASWRLAGLEGQDAMSIGVAAAGAPLLVAGHDLLVRSVDGGASFTPLDPPELPSLDIHAMAQAPSEPDTVYAFVVGAGIHLSLDAGDTWQPAAAVGQTVPPDTAALFVSPDDPDIVLLGSGSQGIFRSDDGAATFSRVSESGTLGLAVGGDPAVAVAATFQGVDVSTDSGRTWVNATPAEDFDGQPLAVTVGDDTLWVVTEQPRVLYRSDDGGTSWQEIARA